MIWNTYLVLHDTVKHLYLEISVAPYPINEDRVFQNLNSQYKNIICLCWLDIMKSMVISRLMTVFPNPFQIASPFYDLATPFGTLAHYVLTHQHKIMEPIKHLCEDENQELQGDYFSGIPNLSFFIWNRAV